MRRVSLRHRLLGASVVLLGGAVLAAQQSPPPPAFRSSVDVVEVDVRVTGRNGEAIRDLGAADFELRDNGKPQVISSVTLIDLAPASSRGTASAVEAALPAVEPRVFVLVLDDLHVDAPSTARVRSLARQFVERSLLPGDRMIVLMPGGGPATAHQFTGDQVALIRAIDAFSGRKLPSAAAEQAGQRATSQELRTWSSTTDRYARERGLNARATLATLRAAADSLREWRGRRKAIVLISEGIDYDVTDAVGRADQPSEADSINQEMRDAVAAAGRTNASIYTIDPRGLAQNTADTLGAGALDRQASDGLRKELLMSQASLREIAETTGGLATVNANDPVPFFNRIVEDTSTYYMVSYSPGPDAKPGTFHKLDVRVRRNGARVRARPGYTSATRVVTTAPAAPDPPTPAPATAPVPAAPVVAPVVAPMVAIARGDPATESLAVVLGRVAAYVADYQLKFAGIVAEEHYQQEVRSFTGSTPGRTGMLSPNRALKSDLLLVKAAGEAGWIQFRDVFEVDGKPVRDRDQRLHKLFVEPSDSSRRQADAIQAEGSRHNIGPVVRTSNVPILALMFLDRSNQSRFAFERSRPGNVTAFAGLAAESSIWAIDFRETAPQTLIRTAGNRDLPSRGRVWVDSTTGRILRTHLATRDTQVSAEITVTYRSEPGVELLVPAEMQEKYLVTQSGVRISGSATYSRFRRFTVVTTEKPQNEQRRMR